MATNLRYSQPIGALAKKVPLASSAAFKDLMGKFVTMDGSGNFNLSASGDTQIWGYADVGAFTGQSTAAIDFIVVERDTQKVYEIPSKTVITEAGMTLLFGKTCDLYTSGTTQQVDTTASTTDVLVIEGWNIAAQTVYVRMNPAKMFTAGVI